MARHSSIIEGGHHGTETDKCKYSLCHLADIAFHLLFMPVACRYNLIHVCLVWFFLHRGSKLRVDLLRVAWDIIRWGVVAPFDT